MSEACISCVRRQIDILKLDRMQTHSRGYIQGVFPGKPGESPFTYLPLERPVLW